MTVTDLASALEQPINAAPTFALERPQDAALADALIDRAFGPGRYAKTAERLREGNRLRSDLSVCAWQGETLIGTVRLWPIRIGDTAAIFLGPIAVDEAARSVGLGGALVERALAAATEAGEQLVLLVGAPKFFERHGFTAVPGGVVMPGPVDPRRLMWRALKAGGLDGVSGVVVRG